jgi:hypothetical protein
VTEAKKTAQNCAKRRTVEQDVRAAEESRGLAEFRRPVLDNLSSASTGPANFRWEPRSRDAAAGAVSANGSRSFVSAITLSAFGHPEWGAPFFGVGVLSWLAIESVLVHRLYAASALPPPLRPTLGIQLAPPTVGCSAYLSITWGPPDLFAQMPLGDDLFQGLLLLRGRLLPPPLLPPA